MERFHEKDVIIPKTKTYELGNLFLDMMRTELVGTKIVLNIASFQEKYSLSLELLKELSRSSEFAMYKIVVCIKEVSKVMKKYIAGGNNVIVVDADSLEYAEHLATAAFVFSNDRLPLYYVRRKEQHLVFLPSDQIQYLLSQLLNATELVSFSKTYTNLVYKEKYGLDGIFRGIVLEPRSVGALKEYARDLIDYVILMEHMGRVECSYFSARKHRLLFVMDMRKKEQKNRWQYISILQQIDSKEYDVTLLLISVLPSWVEELKRLLPQVHIVVKHGKVNYSDEGYIAVERMRYYFSHTTDLERVFRRRPEKELITEWHRLLGETTFEYAYLISPQSVFWYAMFLEVASHKIGIFRTKEAVCCLNEGKTERIYDIQTVQVVSQFDKVVTLEEEAYNAYMENGVMKGKEVIMACLEYYLLYMNKEFAIVRRGEREYFELLRIETGNKIYSGCYVEKKKMDQVAIGCLLNRKDDLYSQDVLATLYSLLEKESRLVFYVGVPERIQDIEGNERIVKCEYEDQIHFIPEELMCVELLSQMNILIGVGKEKQEKIMYLAGKLNKVWLRIETKQNEKELLEYINRKGPINVDDAIYDTVMQYELLQQEEIKKIQQ